MDRIEEQLLALTGIQDDITYCGLVEGFNVPELKKRRDALRQQIADEWRAKDAALEGFGELYRVWELHGPNDAATLIELHKCCKRYAALARVKGGK